MTLLSGGVRLKSPHDACNPDALGGENFIARRLIKIGSSRSASSAEGLARSRTEPGSQLRRLTRSGPSKSRSRSCIAPSVWQSLHLWPSPFLPRRASPLASPAAPASSARPWQALCPPPRTLRRSQAAVRRRRARKSCRVKQGRRASAPACMGCPARVGAISAIIPATASDQSRHYDHLATQPSLRAPRRILQRFADGGAD